MLAYVWIPYLELLARTWLGAPGIFGTTWAHPSYPLNSAIGWIFRNGMEKGSTNQHEFPTPRWSFSEPKRDRVYPLPCDFDSYTQPVLTYLPKSTHSLG